MLTPTHTHTHTKIGPPFYAVKLFIAIWGTVVMVTCLYELCVAGPPFAEMFASAALVYNCEERGILSLCICVCVCACVLILAKSKTLQCGFQGF